MVRYQRITAGNKFVQVQDECRFFLPNIFDSWLMKSSDIEALHMEGWLYTYRPAYGLTYAEDVSTSSRVYLRIA